MCPRVAPPLVSTLTSSEGWRSNFSFKKNKKQYLVWNKGYHQNYQWKKKLENRLMVFRFNTHLRGPLFVSQSHQRCLTAGECLTVLSRALRSIWLQSELTDSPRSIKQLVVVAKWSVLMCQSIYNAGPESWRWAPTAARDPSHLLAAGLWEINGLNPNSRCLKLLWVTLGIHNQVIFKKKKKDAEQKYINGFDCVKDL